MQCSSCRFENMPGVGTCGRCGSPLGLKSLAVDVHPPRAGGWTKRLRRWLPLRPVYYGARNASHVVVREGLSRIAGRPESLRVPLAVLARLIVPGWPHFYLGERDRGRMFLVGYLAFLLLSFLLYGSVPGAMFLGLAFSVHIVSCVSVLRVGGTFGPAYWGGVALVFVLLLVGVYLPAGWLVSQVVLTAQIQIDARPFERGDILLYSPLLDRHHDWHPGDVVVYDQRGGTYPLPGAQHGNIYVGPGARVDRILAGPGEAVAWEDGQLTVNGQPSPLRSLNPEMRIPKLSLKVPDGYYLILPTAGPGLPDQLAEQVLRDLVIVPAGAIRGRVLLCSYPLTRIRRFS
jgi:hypothetical protein